MSWRKIHLGDLVENYSIRARDAGGSDGLTFFGVSNESGIIETKYAAEHKAEYYKIIEKDCFAYNPYRINVGSIGLLDDNRRGLISPAYVVFKPKPKSIIPELLLAFLKSKEGLRQINFFARGTVRQALRFEDLCKIELSLPDFQEQTTLFEKIKNIHVECSVLDSELTHQLTLVKQLRQAFLSEAMQGKLVESGKWKVRKGTEETGQQLLERIRKEKQELIKSGKLKKEKPRPPIKPEEIPFEIPEDWVWCRLGEVVNFLNGYAFKSEWFKSEGIPLLRNINLGINEIVWNDIAKLPKEKAAEFKEYYLAEGDIILSLDRPIINAGLKIAQIKKEDTPCLLLQRVLKVTPFFINGNYLYRWFNTGLFLDSINPGRSIGIPHISHNDVAKILIPIPPINEQQRIVQMLDQLMSLCDELESSIRASKEQNDQLLQEVLREAMEGEKYEMMEEDLRVAAEADVEYNQKN